MMLRDAIGDDIPEIVAMYRELLDIAYPRRDKAPMVQFYKVITEWLFTNRVKVVVKDCEIHGFSMCVLNVGRGLMEPLIDAEVVYVKEGSRRTKAGFLMFNDIVDYAKEKKMGISIGVIPGIEKMIRKRYNFLTSFVYLESTKEDVQKHKQ